MDVSAKRAGPRQSVLALPSARHRMSAGRILVIDDDAEMCALLDCGLTKRGFEVTTRTSGDAAIALLDTSDFDAIVVDLNMPGTSGLDGPTWVPPTSPSTLSAVDHTRAARNGCGDAPNRAAGILDRVRPTGLLRLSHQAVRAGRGVADA